MLTSRTSVSSSFQAGRSWDPVPWTAYFERELFLPSDDGSITYHAYLTSPAPPSGSSKTPGPLFVTHHGAGSSGLSFAVLGSEIRKRLPSAGILSLDARGHGLTSSFPSSSSDPTTPQPQDDTAQQDLSLATLAQDLLSVLFLTQRQMHWPSLPPIIFVGHSLGGAVVTHAAAELIPSLPREKQQAIDLLGYAVLDVVEGSAMDALQSMHAYLATRPSGFGSISEAIEWHVRSRTLRNGVSARVSVPGLLVKNSNTASSGSSSSSSGSSSAAQGDGSVFSGARRQKEWTWKTDLAKTQPFWEGWFRGLSGKFLRGRGGKMLLLAGTDRLDTELTIGQMQGRPSVPSTSPSVLISKQVLGKYALQVFPEAGHFIHEDLPEKTAMVLVDFHRRNDRSALVLPPKVSELLAQGKKV